MWTLRGELCGKHLGHLDVLMDMVYLAKTHQLVTVSLDKTVRVWSINKATGAIEGVQVRREAVPVPEDAAKLDVRAHLLPEHAGRPRQTHVRGWPATGVGPPCCLHPAA